MPIGPMLAWKRGDLLGAAQRLVVAFLAGIAAILIFAAWHGGPVRARSSDVGGLAVFSIVGAFSDIVGKLLSHDVGNAPGRVFQPAAQPLGHGLRACRYRRHFCSALPRQGGASKR